MNTPFFPARYVDSMVRTEMRWHDTTGDCFRGIVVDGLILPPTAYQKVRGVCRVAFSNPVWEATACKGLVEPGRLLPGTATFAETLNLGHGLVRIGVDPQTAPYNFRALVSRSGMPRRQARRLLVRVASEMGADLRDWWGTFVPVPHHLWTAVEVWHEDHWEAISTPRPHKVSL